MRINYIVMASSMQRVARWGDHCVISAKSMHCIRIFKFIEKTRVFQESVPTNFVKGKKYYHWKQGTLSPGNQICVLHRIPLKVGVTNSHCLVSLIVQVWVFLVKLKIATPSILRGYCKASRESTRK